ncbi:MAG TPA: amidohydrolase family protein [Terracidiphilus sp.]|nr:amidohydrolase family protein [Terracidiphilus sp.]
MCYDAKTSPIETPGASKPLDLSEFEPQSMLAVKQTNVERSRFPVIDIHAHMSFSNHVVNGVHLGAERQYLASPEELLPVMDRKNILMLNNLTAGFGSGLDEAISRYDKAYPGRFCAFTEPWFSRFLEPDYPRIQAEAMEQARRSGARGLKILKTLGLFLREGITTGNLVQIDDPRFDSMWEACANLDMPVAMHVSDPAAFFKPTDRFNERFEELNHHPDWSFYGQGFPANNELLDARDRVMARHSRTQFIALHVGNFAEDLNHVASRLDRFPNMSVDVAARVGELGRQPRAARAFFEKYQDRILFGTDAIPHANDYPQQLFCDRLYEIYYRFLETDDESFDYAPARIPPQGRWQISGIDLPDSILKKVYYENAARLLHLAL